MGIKNMIVKGFSLLKPIPLKDKIINYASLEVAIKGIFAEIKKKEPKITRTDVPENNNQKVFSALGALNLKNWLVTNYTTLMNNIRDSLTTLINGKLSHGGYGGTGQTLFNLIESAKTALTSLINANKSKLESLQNDKQNKSDPALATIDKTVVGGINENKGKIDKINARNVDSVSTVYSINSSDTRNVEESPSEINQGLRLAFKDSKAGLNVYSGLLTVKPYGGAGDFSGGMVQQLIFSKMGEKLLRRFGDRTGWFENIEIFDTNNCLLSKNKNGYQEFPSGLTIQWGEITLNNRQESRVMFPIAFTSDQIRIIGSQNTTYQSASNPDNQFQAYGATQTYFMAYSNEPVSIAGTMTYSWLAFGYNN